MAVETISGLSAGLLSTLLVHPLDLVKTRLQSKHIPAQSRHPLSRLSGTTLTHRSRRLQDEKQVWNHVPCVQVCRSQRGQWIQKPLPRSPGKRDWKHDQLGPLLFGVRHLSLTCCCNANLTVSCSSYGELKARMIEYRGDKLSGSDYLLTAGTAGVLTAVCTNPLWIVKTRMLATAANAPDAYPTMFAGFKTIVKKQGPLGLMRGLTPAMFGVTHGALQFTFYEKLKVWRGIDSNRNLTYVDFIGLSATAKISAGLMTYPYKVVQTRYQNFESGYTSPWDVVRKLWTGEGYRGFYKG